MSVSRSAVVPNRRCAGTVATKRQSIHKGNFSAEFNARIFSPGLTRPPKSSKSFVAELTVLPRGRPARRFSQAAQTIDTARQGVSQYYARYSTSRRLAASGEDGRIGSFTMECNMWKWMILRGKYILCTAKSF